MSGPRRKGSISLGLSSCTSLPQRAAAEGLSLLDYLSILRSTLLSMFQAKPRRLVTPRRIRHRWSLTEIGHITGELSRISNGGVTVTNNVMVLNSPAFAQLQTVILQALAPHPAARADVILALRQLETEPEPLAAPLALEARPVGEERHDAA
jgi:hypothetical protein